MITVKRLKKLLAKVPDDAHLWAYEGEDVGITIEKGQRHWWIRATDGGWNGDEMDTYTTGF